MEWVLEYNILRACIGYPDLQCGVEAKSSIHSALHDSRSSDVDLLAATPFKRRRACAATNLELLISPGYQYDHVLRSNRQCCLHNGLCFVFSVNSQELLDLYSMAMVRVSPKFVFPVPMGGGLNTEDKEEESMAPTEDTHAATRLYLKHVSQSCVSCHLSLKGARHEKVVTCKNNHRASTLCLRNNPKIVSPYAQPWTFCWFQCSTTCGEGRP